MKFAPDASLKVKVFAIAALPDANKPKPIAAVIRFFFMILIPQVADALRRRATNTIKPKPESNNAQDSGSGTGASVTA